MRTNVYINGGNPYHGLLRYHPELKWLDLEIFHCQSSRFLRVEARGSDTATPDSSTD